MPFTLPRLYPITDTRLSGLTHAEQVTRLIADGATLIQLREKHASPNEFYLDAKAAMVIARAHGVRIIINDRVDLAMALKADGVHLGQDDLPPQAARKLLGDAVIIGYSTHSVEQAKKALALPVDYIAIGPVYSTSSKENPAPVVGIDGIRQVRDAIGSLPLVAIGGITRMRCGEVFAAGADAVASISNILDIIRETE